MTVTKEQLARYREAQKKKYKTIHISTTEEVRQKIKDRVAADEWETMTAMITAAIEQKIERDRKSNKRKNQVRQVAKAWDDSGITVQETLRFIKRQAKKRQK